MIEPTVAQMERMVQSISKYRGFRQLFDEVRNNYPAEDVDDDDWLKHESPQVIKIARDTLFDVLNVPRPAPVERGHPNPGCFDCEGDPDLCDGTECGK